MTDKNQNPTKQVESRETVFCDGLFKDKVVLISGGATGLGKHAAEQFARLGATLVICGRDADRLNAAAEALRKHGTRVIAQPMTIRDPDQVSELMDVTWREFGRLDVLINNAGGQFASPALDIKPKGWNAVIDTNLNGTWYMMQAAAQRWKEHQQPGNIINVVVVIWRGLPMVAHTCAARAGVIFLSKTVSVEWAPYNIRVNCLAPGTIKTDAFGYYNEAGQASFEQANPMKHAGTPTDITEGITYLASDASKYITGEVLNIDGGQQNWGDPWFGGRPEYFELDYASARRVE
ncbi:SDR family oxidoreductase [Castellaniella sp.]|uniref:SDR family oxidoreductase n=1 Tax=Castellaniella sp. TaxID=1955812 RepID=UPI003567984C